MPDDNNLAESRALATAKWANLFMCFAGVFAAYLSRADALLVDGLYSGVNFFSAIIAARVANAIRQPADHRFPFGYDAFEALYVTFRSLVLTGILVFAVFSAGEKILTYLSGGEVPELIMGPIFIYSAAMVVICFSLAWRFHNAWVKTGRVSALLLTERRASLVDGLLSAGAGVALLASPLLLRTPLAGLVPIADAMIVLLLTLVMLPQPIAMLRASLAEVSGAAASPEAHKIAHDFTTQALVGVPFQLLDIAITKLGRTHFVVVYLTPEEPICGAVVDSVRERLIRAYSKAGQPVRCEVVTTAVAPFTDTGLLTG